MAANIGDYFTKAGVKNGGYPTIATVSSARSKGEKNLVCDDLAGWTTETPVHISTFQVDANDEIVPNSQSDWKGIVKENTITELQWIMGAEDSGNQPGDRVELNPTNGWLDDLVTGILKSHNQDGTLKNDIILSQIYPVGSIYITTTDNSPQKWLGGTWEAFGKGKTLVGVNPDDEDFNAANKEGGSKTVTLTTEQMPKHKHGLRWGTNSGGSMNSITMGAQQTGYTSDQCQETGGGKPHENMPPYITVYFWHRTA